MGKLIESTHVALGGEIDPDVRRFASGVLVLIYTPKLAG